MQPIRKLRLTSTARDLSFCSKENIFLLTNYDQVLIYNADLQCPLHSIKHQGAPKSAQLSPCGKYFYLHDSNNQILLYDTKTATLLQKIYGVPVAAKNIKFSGNSQRIIYGGTQMLCLWSIREAALLMRTQTWKNINCYDLSNDGHQFALGTYSGSIYVMDFVSADRCQQIQIRKHKHCVMCICIHNNKIISFGYGGQFLISTVERTQKGQKAISYNELKLQLSPRSIESVGDRFYIFDKNGMCWLNKCQKLVGFNNGVMYRPLINENGILIFVKYDRGVMQWWLGTAFKSQSEASLESNLPGNTNIRQYRVIRRIERGARKEIES